MKLSFGALALVLLLGGHTANAATLYMDPGVTTISRGDAVKVSVRLDTDEETEECINAVEGGGNLCDSQNMIVRNKGVDYIIDNFAASFSEYLID